MGRSRHTAARSLLFCVLLQLALRRTGAEVVELLWFIASPETVSYIGQGESIKWVWWDNGNYSVEGVGDAAAMFTGVGGGANAVSGRNFTYTVTFNVPGSFEYRCHNHPYIMFGYVQVKPQVNFGGIRLPFFMGVSFGGLSAIVCQNDTVEWEWGDELAHGLTAVGNSTEQFTGEGANANLVTGSGFVFKKKYANWGQFDYKCHNHGLQMFGRITVVRKGLCFSPPPRVQSPPPPPPRPRPPPRKNPPPPRKSPPPPGRKPPPPRKQPPPPRKRPPPPRKTPPPPKTGKK